MSTSNKGQVGRLNKSPNKGVRRDPLDWKTLKGESSEARNALVVQRANFFTQILPDSREDAYSQAFRAARYLALETKSGWDMNRPEVAPEVPTK